jgi:hypothetical protein
MDSKLITEDWDLRRFQMAKQNWSIGVLEYWSIEKK